MSPTRSEHDQGNACRRARRDGAEGMALQEDLVVVNMYVYYRALRHRLRTSTGLAGTGPGS